MTSNSNSPLPAPCSKLKVLTVVGTRPEIIRLSCVLKKLDASPAVEHTLVHTGQNYDYELNEVFFEDLGLRKPDYFLNAAGASATETTGQILIKIEPVMEAVRPDAFLVLGDTNSCLCAIAAKKRHIPIFHMEAGNRCFDQRVPEESNRKIVDHISDINLTYSDIAREYLLREGLPPDRIIKTGSPMYEVLHHYMSKIEKSKILEILDLVLKCESSKVLKCEHMDNQTGLREQRAKSYFVVSAHREENISSERNFVNLVSTLNLIAERYGFPIIVSTHPRTRKMIELKGIVFNPLIRLIKPLGLSDYLALQMNAKVVLSDSGTISEESSILNFPALNIREAHERPEAMEEAAVMMVGLSPDRVMQGLAQLETQGRGERGDGEHRTSNIQHRTSNGKDDLTQRRRGGEVSGEDSEHRTLNIEHSTSNEGDGESSKVLKFESSKVERWREEDLTQRRRDAEVQLRPVSDYSMPNVSDKVVRIILSYTDYVNRVVWQK